MFFFGYLGENNILFAGNLGNATSGAAGGAETRPKNVALLYCRKN